jgi:hypothetical protein
MLQTRLRDVKHRSRNAYLNQCAQIKQLGMKESIKTQEVFLFRCVQHVMKEVSKPYPAAKENIRPEVEWQEMTVPTIPFTFSPY